MNELLPCPFCGDTADLAEDTDRPGVPWTVFCESCDASTGNYEESAEAVTHWNRRAALAAQPGAAGDVVMVDRAALHMVVNALRRDAEEGRYVRGEMADMLLAAAPTEAKPAHRACTCHPDDNPPKPCPQKFALSECRAVAQQDDETQAVLIEGVEYTVPMPVAAEMLRLHLEAKPAQQDAVDAELEPYDAGLLNDFGGGNVEWWQDYIRAELGRAHDFYQTQCAAISAKKGG